MPGQRLPVPALGEGVAIFGTWVNDKNHGWNEIHPIWAIRYLDRNQTVVSIPDPWVIPFGGREAGETPVPRPIHRHHEVAGDHDSGNGIVG